MHPQKEAICIIPARGGSKRIKGKNIRLFGGIPMIAHAVNTARDSKCFSRIIVSTDNEDIAAISRDHGAETPFVRDAQLADDHTPTAPVVADAIIRTGSQDTEYTCCIYPSTPMLRPDDVAAALDLMDKAGADALLSVTEFDYPPLRALKPGPGNTVAFNWPQYETTRSQDLPDLIHDAGQFYWMRTKPFLKDPRLVPQGTIAYRMDRLRCADIDTEEDLAFAEAVFRYNQQTK